MSKKLSSMMSGVGAKKEESTPAVPDVTAAAPAPVSPPSRLTPPSQKGETFMQMPRQTLIIDLPISKRQISCSHILLDPQQVQVGSYNKRIQSLLSENDPAMQELVASMADGQRDPVLVRALKDGTDIRYELIYGSRRRFAAQLLNQREEGEYKLRAWVSSEIPEIDARKLSHAENNERENISSWEQAVYLKKVQEQNPTWTQEVIAANEGIQQGTVSRLLALASIPENLVKLLTSPQLLGMKTGAKLASAWTKQPAKRQGQILDQLIAKGPFATDKALLSELAQLFEGKKSVPKGREKVRWISEDEKSSVLLGRHRTKADNFTIELDGFSEEQLAEVTKLLSKALRLKEQ